ncbi:conserved virulence factor C family protein [Paenibacillus tarimensis]|uniref:conserved virulence factor C family protein n=1 Tax=Paenibacillus tarimensis TaxID=416012 RepID=UPI001F29AE80|nr:conserved virulence factor C family protein [Paenibacillus tarimensis]MCF2944992.1 conserved virulence factor C family protein [Paenibacillus tarimensis]
MKLLSIEPTPSPNSMKLNVDEKWPSGRRATYTLEQKDEAPEFFRGLLAIEGVRSVFRTADFIALDRKPGADWQRILSDARALFEAGDEAGGEGGVQRADETNTGFGEAHVLVQTYRGIPIQIRVRMADHESRLALPEPFGRAVREAAGATMIMERKLEEYGIRYGEPDEIAAEVAQELAAAYPEERLNGLIEAARLAARDENGETEAPAVPVRPRPLTAEELAEALRSPDWQTRYAALERTQPTPELLSLIASALHDEKASIRRLAVVYLGDLRMPEALPHLFSALKDKTPSVRRTAGDTLSDLGDPSAVGPMIDSLRDPNKLVRWRAARFLYEAGDETALEALQEAAQDEEFEVRLQAQIALERIQRGEEAAGSVWQQMTASRSSGQTKA